MAELAQTGRLRTVFLLLWTYRGKSSVVLSALLLSGIAGGVGMLTVLPLLEISIGGGGAESRYSQYYTAVLWTFGLLPTIGTTLLIIVLLICAKSLLNLVAMDYVGRVVAQMASDLRIRLMRAIASASWKFFVSNPIGKFTNAVVSHPQEASSTYRASCQFMAAILETAILVVVSLMISPVATLGGVLFGLLVVTLLGRFVAIARRAGSQTFVAMEALSSQLADLLQGIKTLKAMNCERQLTPILEHESEEINQATRKLVLAKYGLSTMREPVAALVLALGLYLALSYAKIGMPELVTTAILFYRISVAIGSIQAAYQIIGSSERFYWGLEELTDDALRNAEPTNSGKLKPPTDWRSVEFDAVSFDYEGKEVLKDVSLKIQRRTFTAIVGPSGSGKTTLVDILCAIVNPRKGNVCIDGLVLSEVDIGVWRRNIGYVPQEFSLFHDTVMNNVSLRDSSVSREDVERALRAAEAWGFIEELSMGIDTVVGERGLTLSGGQRQRIAIARALVRNPQLLILDEATTALDPKTEKEVLDTLKKLASHVTVVAISHQPALMAAADRVFMLERGALHEIERQCELSTLRAMLRTASRADK
jgi:ATP-binding cassette subfamily C protein